MTSTNATVRNALGAKAKNSRFNVGDRVWFKAPVTGAKITATITEAKGGEKYGFVDDDGIRGTVEGKALYALNATAARNMSGLAEKGRKALIDGMGLGFVATLEKEVKSGNASAMKKLMDYSKSAIASGDQQTKEMAKASMQYLKELGEANGIKGLNATAENALADYRLKPNERATVSAIVGSLKDALNKMLDLQSQIGIKDENGNLNKIIPDIQRMYHAIDEERYQLSKLR